MHHYIALVWQPSASKMPRDARRIEELLRAASDTWTKVVGANGLLIFTKNSVDAALRTYVLPNGNGAIFGKLFRTGDTHREVRESDLASLSLVDGDISPLLEGYWGSYVAVLSSRRGDNCAVIRDCSGHIPCYYTEVGGLYIFFSDICDLKPFGFRFTINEQYVAALILRHPFHVRDTGLKEVSELLAGDGVFISQKTKDHRCVWDPRAIAARQSTDDYAKARAELIRCTDLSISSWATMYGRMLVNLSGGLDSAIVLGTLKRLGFAENVVCVNHFTDATADDERAYARAAADMAGVALYEVPRVCDGRIFAERLQMIPPEPKPDVAKIVRVLMVEGLNRLAATFQCASVWTGQGGDHLFLQAHHAYGAADYVAQHRVPWRLLTMVHDSALLSGHSVWSVLGDAIRDGWVYRKSPPETLSGSGRRFLAHSVTAEYNEESISLPWHKTTVRLPPGKHHQIDQLSDVLNRERPLIGLQQPYHHHPLISQPLIELSLQVPTYHLLRGGRQRAMARDAFQDRVPPCILKRENKGDTKDQTRTLLRRTSNFLSQVLLDGDLVALGIIDRSPLERILRQQDTYGVDDVFPIWACVAAEIWARHWRPSAAKVAAA